MDQILNPHNVYHSSFVVVSFSLVSFSIYYLIFCFRFLSSLSLVPHLCFILSLLIPCHRHQIPFLLLHSLIRTHPWTALYCFFLRFSFLTSSHTVLGADSTILYSTLRLTSTPLPSSSTPSPRRPTLAVQSSSFSFPPPHVCERVESESSECRFVYSQVVVGND